MTIIGLNQPPATSEGMMSHRQGGLDFEGVVP
jgi:hypothetical protein